MKSYPFLATISLALLCLSFSGCGKAATHKDLANKMGNSMEEFADVISGISDKASAEAAKPKLQAIVKRLDEIVEQGKALPNPSSALEDEMNEIIAVGKGKMESAMMQFQQKVLADPSIAMVLMDVMKEMGD